MRKDYYKILGLTHLADESAIKKAYRSLAKMYHPDLNKTAEAQEKFLEINEAYEFLIDNNNRKNYFEPTVGDWRQKEYENEEFRRMKEEMKEKARQRAQMRYEDLQKQYETFQKSGLYDLAILGKYALKTIILLFPFLFIFNIVRFTLNFEQGFLIANIILLILSGVFALYILRSWNYLFKQEELYYNFSRIKTLLNERHESNLQCFYCKNKIADSRSYTVEMIKMKDVKLEFKGFRQQKVNYKTDKEKIIVPRCLKSYRIHVLCSVIKILAIVGTFIFLPIESFLWEIILGMLAGEIITVSLLAITRTKSNISYLYSWGMLLKICIWMGVIISMTQFQWHPFNIFTSEYIRLAFFCLLLADSFIEQFVFSIPGRVLIKPIARQPEGVSLAYSKGYRLYGDIPVFSVIYPWAKWFLG